MTLRFSAAWSLGGNQADKPCVTRMAEMPFAPIVQMQHFAHLRLNRQPEPLWVALTTKDEG
ncbi:hypothetical protein ACEYYA_01515 [Paracoccus sp. p3-h83]|uniref:hypothetical protein n=1 Tax=Paracoccus sp. p3-h83 TaxID=3342805 RepID=UPI0035B98CEE